MGIEQYVGRVALVTGASGGLGAAIAQGLQKAGLKVVGIARRVGKIEILSVPGAPGKLYGFQCDISNEKDVLDCFKWIKEKLGGVDVLVNCVGITTDQNLTEADTSQWRQVLDVNVIGLSVVTREAVKDMRDRGIDDGYIIHVNGLAAYKNPLKSSKAMYYATKHAVRALAEGFRFDIVENVHNIRSTCISPGAVKTEKIVELTKYYDDILERMPFISPEYIADMVIFVLSRPPRVQIQDIIVDATESTMF